MFGSWFGMCGEVFIDVFVNKVLQLPIPLWEYRIMPIHNAMTSSYGPIMWGVAAIGICMYEHYSPKKRMKVNRLTGFLIESWFLMLSELFFDITAYLYLDEYFFYYYSPEFLHFSAFVNIPMWWCGYKMMVKGGDALDKKEKISIPLAVMMVVTVVWGFQ